MEEIQKDVRRTRSNLCFFSKPLDIRDMPKSDSDSKRLEMQFETTYIEMTDQDRELYIETHADVLTRILFIYAKLNPGIKYV